MNTSSKMVRRARDERGGALVMFTLFLPVIVLLATFVVDVGNWFEHKRHLQMQVDAGAFAGGGLFTQCFGDQNIANTAIDDEVRKYAGATGSSYNRQIGGSNQGAITIRINRKTYEVGGPGPDDTVEAEPCSAGMIDVKGTEANLPWLLGLVPGSVVPSINAHARVRIFGVTSRAGNLPIAAPDNDVRTAEARFVDEDTGQLLGSTPLQPAGLSNGLSIFRSTTPASVLVGPLNRNIGLRIVLSHTTSTTCGQFLVECYDTDPSRPNGGLIYLRGWRDASPAAQDPPLAERVSLFPAGTCVTSAFFSDKDPCTAFGVRARIVWAGGRQTTDEVVAFGGGCGANGCSLQFDSASGDWISNGTSAAPYVTIPAGTDDRVPITLRWERRPPTRVNGYRPCTTNKNNPCQDFFELGAPLQRTFGAAVDLSGPIKHAKVTDSSAAPVDQLHLPASGTTAFQLNAEVGVIPNFKNAQSISDPVVALRIAKEIDNGGSSSRNQSIDCDPNWSNLRDELKNGCRPQYTINNGTVCADPGTLWSLPQPWNCVKVETGGATGQVNQGMTDRILRGGNCSDHPNNWSLFPNFPQGDTRIVSVILTSFGAFGGQGQGTIPVTGFATFYVTGWPRQGSNRKQTAYCSGDDTPVPKGYILGHFINYIDAFGTGSGTDPCPFLDPNYSGLGSCYAVLTD